jgi:hypothetical protein
MRVVEAALGFRPFTLPFLFRTESFVREATRALVWRDSCPLRGFVGKTLSGLLEIASVLTSARSRSSPPCLWLRAPCLDPGNLTRLPPLFRSTRPTESLLCGQSENSACDCR